MTHKAQAGLHTCHPGLDEPAPDSDPGDPVPRIDWIAGRPRNDKATAAFAQGCREFRRRQ